MMIRVWASLVVLHSCAAFCRLPCIAPTRQAGLWSASGSYGGESQRPLGTISLVGGGPGDPELLTIKAVRELENADLVIADRLIPKEILDLCEGELRVARKHPGCAEQAQQEIYEWAKEALREGKRVVRLKIGDPFVFGRGGEEVLEFRKFGVEPKVIPGISSVFSAPLLAGIPVTHRGIANQVVMGTGYGRDCARPEMHDFHPDKTAVFLMAIGRLKELASSNHHPLYASYPMDTPVGIIEKASTPLQRVICGRLNTIFDIAQELKASHVKAPSTIVVGEAVFALHGESSGLVEDKSRELADLGAEHRASALNSAGVPKIKSLAELAVPGI
ncbi:unnamed protein product [Chrysoparadoxa australica]